MEPEKYQIDSRVSLISHIPSGDGIEFDIDCLVGSRAVKIQVVLRQAQCQLVVACVKVTQHSGGPIEVKALRNQGVAAREQHEGHKGLETWGGVADATSRRLKK